MYALQSWSAESNFFADLINVIFTFSSVYFESLQFRFTFSWTSFDTLGIIELVARDKCAVSGIRLKIRLLPVPFVATLLRSSKNTVRSLKKKKKYGNLFCPVCLASINLLVDHSPSPFPVFPSLCWLFHPEQIPIWGVFSFLSFQAGANSLGVIDTLILHLRNGMGFLNVKR